MYIELHNRPCPLCGSGESRHLFSGKDYRYNTVGNEFEYHTCTDCSHVFLKTFPNQEDIARLYPGELMNYGEIETARSVAYKVKNMLDLRALRKLLARYKILNVRALDIGCGSGLYLDQIHSLAKSIKIETLEGIEISEHAMQTAAAKGYNIHTCLLENYKPDRKYNLVIMQQVVEHLYDLDLSFTILAEILSDDGILLVETPNLNCFDRRLFGKYWEGYHVPRHFNLFEKTNLEKWLKKFNLRIDSYELTIKPVHWTCSIENIFLAKDNRMAAFFRYKNPVWLVLFSIVDLVQLLLLRKASNIRYIIRKNPGAPANRVS